MLKEMKETLEATCSEIIDISLQLRKDNANEAETRLKLINDVIFRVLGWRRDDVKPEEHVSEDGKSTYADYIIRTANTAIIIEAKKIGVQFSIPPKTKVKTLLSGKIMEGELGDAIRQAREYCRKKSIPFAVVTNGDAWVVFPAIRTDQVEFSNSNAVIFESLSDALGDRLEHFYAILSRDGAINGVIERELLGTRDDQVNERRLRSFFNSGPARNINPIFPLIEREIHTAFSGAISSSGPDILKACYVKNPLDLKFDSRIRMHIQKAQNLFSSSPIRPLSKKKKGSVVDLISQVKAGDKPLAMLILGTVGSGKTTFIEYTRKVSAADFFEAHPDDPYNHWIHIDFRSFSKSESPKDFIYGKIFEYIKKDSYFSKYDRGVNAAYRDEIEALKNGPLFLLSKDESELNSKISEIIVNDYKKVEPYVYKLIKAASLVCSIFVVIDNVDQIEDVGVVKDVFSDAMAFAQGSGINLVMAMRESTYVLHKNSPTFDAFDFDPIQIDPPDLRAVLSRRFFLARELLEGKSGSFTASGGAQFHVGNLADFMDVVQSSVLGTRVGERIEVLAQNDIRLALRMTREFLERGYTDPAQAINKHSEGQRYMLPKHEALRAILLGNNPVYSEEVSPIGNPFDSKLNKTSAQLLRLFVLAALVRVGANATAHYLDGPEIRSNLRDIGFSDEYALKVLKDLCALRFVQTHSHQEADFDSAFFATRLGGHIVKDLIADMTFVETVMMDTFIADDEVWARLKSFSQRIRDERDTVKRINIRITRLAVFFKYMQRLYEEILTQAKERSMKREWLTNPIEEIRNDFINSLKGAKISAYKNYRGVDITERMKGFKVLDDSL